MTNTRSLQIKFIARNDLNFYVSVNMKGLVFIADNGKKVTTEQNYIVTF
jgi:hypothetical protein